MESNFEAELAVVDQADENKQADQANQADVNEPQMVDATELTHTFFEVLAELVVEQVRPATADQLEAMIANVFETFVEDKPEDFMKHCAVICGQAMKLRLEQLQAIEEDDADEMPE